MSYIRGLMALVQFQCEGMMQNAVIYDIAYRYLYIQGLVQDFSNSSALAMELLYSDPKPLIYLSKIMQQVKD